MWGTPAPTNAASRPAGPQHHTRTISQSLTNDPLVCDAFSRLSSECQKVLSAIQSHLFHYCADYEPNGYNATTANVTETDCEAAIKEALVPSPTRAATDQNVVWIVIIFTLAVGIGGFLAIMAVRHRQNQQLKSTPAITDPNGNPSSFPPQPGTEGQTQHPSSIDELTRLGHTTHF